MEYGITKEQSMKLFHKDFIKKVESFIKVTKYKLEGCEKPENSPFIDKEKLHSNSLNRHRKKGFTFHGK